VNKAAAEEFQPYVDEEPEQFQEWIADQELSEKEKVLWNFHRWMRQETDLESGSIVDYRKYVAEMLSDDGELIVKPSELGNHKRAAVNKFRDFAKTTTEGDME
jgi:hypothetical protein